MTFHALGRLLFCLSLGCIPANVAFAQGDPTIDATASSVLGRWDVTVHGPEGDYPSWFEVSKSGHGTLVGSFVARFGSARPVSKVEFQDGRMQFVVPVQWEKHEHDVVFEGRLEGDRFRGETTTHEGKPVQWGAVRAPDLDRPEPTAWGEPIELFNGRDLVGWKQQAPGSASYWSVEGGIIRNSQIGDNLVTERRFDDFKLLAEFRYPPGSNSGIYLRGRYELQIIDGSSPIPNAHDIGAIYGFIIPSDNAAKPANEWQTYEITLVGRRVTVVLNGQRIIDRQRIPGITGGALDSDEGAPGPILLQGDHGPVDFRKLTLTPAK